MLRGCAECVASGTTVIAVVGFDARRLRGPGTASAVLPDHSYAEAGLPLRVRGGEGGERAVMVLVDGEGVVVHGQTPPVATNEMSGGSSTSAMVTVTVILSSTLVSALPSMSLPSRTDIVKE